MLYNYFPLAEEDQHLWCVDNGMCKCMCVTARLSHGISLWVFSV